MLLLRARRDCEKASSTRATGRRRAGPNAIIAILRMKMYKECQLNSLPQRMGLTPAIWGNANPAR